MSNTKKETPKAVEPVNETNYITKDELAGMLDKFLDKVNDTIEAKMPTVIREEKAIDNVENSATTGVSDPMIPAEYRQMVDEVLGKDFGIRISYPSKGSGFIFRVIVPKDKSNASDFYYEMYKEDVRSKALSGGEGSDVIRLHCERIARNLGIDKRDIK
jgi:hypothetical protein